MNTALTVAFRAAVLPALLAFFPPFSAARPVEPPETIPPVWEIHSFVEDAGLVECNVFDMAFEPDGTLWAATSGGLARYDGYEWTRYTTRDGLPGNFIRAVRLTENGGLWVGSDKGAGIYDPAAKTYDPMEEGGGRAGPNVRRIWEDPDGTLWFARDRWPFAANPGGLSIFRNGVWSETGGGEGFASDYVYDTLRTTAGRRFALTGDGIFERRGGRWFPLTAGEGPLAAPEHPRDAAELDDGSVLFSAFRAMYVWRDGVLRAHPHAFAEAPPLCVDASGRALTCLPAGAGFLRFFEWSGEEWVPLGDPFPMDGVPRFMAVAPDGAVWTAGSCHLARWNRERPEWTGYRGLPPPVLVDGEGGVWFSGGGRTLRLFGDRWEEIAGGEYLFKPGRGGSVWGLGADGMVSWSGGRFERHPSADLGMAEPGHFNIDPLGQVWVFGHNAEGRRILARRAEGEWTVFDRDECQTGQLAAGAPDPDGGVWMLLTSGAYGEYRLLRFDGEVFLERLLDPITRNLSSNFNIYIDSNRDLWLFGRHGLYRFGAKEGRWEEIPEGRGRYVFYCVGSGNALWFGSSGPAMGGGAILRYAGGRFARLPAPVLGFGVNTEDGGAMFSGDGALYRVSDGTGWNVSTLHLPAPGLANHIADAGGEIWARLNDVTLRYRPDGVPPRCRVANAAADYLQDQAVRIRFEAREYGKSYSHPGRFMFSRSLDGGEWSPFEAIDSLRLDMADLRVGRHRLEVRVRDEGLDESAAPAVYEFDVLPMPLQMRGWFMPAVLLTIGLLVAMVLITLRARHKLGFAVTDLETMVDERTAALRESEQRFRNYFEMPLIGIAISLPDKRWLEVNRKTCDILGYSREELMNIDWASITHPDDLEPNRELFEKALRGEIEQYTLEKRFIRKDGETVHTHLSARCVRGDDGKAEYFVTLIQDITAAKRERAEREALEAQLVRSQKLEAIGQLAGGIAHDFNNLMTAVNGYSDLLLDQLPPGGMARECVMEIQKAGERAAQLTRQLLAFGRRQMLMPEIMQLNAAIEDIAPMLRRLIPADIGIRFRLADDLGPVEADPGQIQQILLNLAVNARDAMPDGGTLTMETANAEARELPPDPEAGPADGKWVMLAIHDTGVGMDSETRARIFEPFFTTKETGKGTGLGLATVYGIVSQSGGRIGVDSEPGKGTVFRVYLPAAAAPPAEPAADGDIDPARENPV